MFEVLDEEDLPWVVDKGDPAEAACKRLEKAGFRQLVLPRHTLQTGEVRELTDGDTGRAETALAGLTLADRVPKLTARQMRRTAERRVRLLQCVRHLS